MEQSGVVGEAGARRSGVLTGLVAATRPRQWSKNLVVMAAPVFAGRVGDLPTLTAAVLAIVVFTVAASGVYLFNDARDVAHDRVHPTKRFRPVAAGRVPVRVAATTGVALMVVACLGAAASGWQLVVVITTYCVVNLAYCLALKNEPVLDIAIIALGFLLRAVAGGVACGIPLSQWFLLIASFGSLFMAAGKRYGEVRLVGERNHATRRSLARYSESYLRFVWSTSAGLLIMAYALWAVELRHQGDLPWTEISLAPFVLIVLRYAAGIDAGLAEEPEEVVLADHVLQGLGAVWLLTVVLAVYTR